MKKFGCQWCEMRFDSEQERFWHNVRDHGVETTEKYGL